MKYSLFLFFPSQGCIFSLWNFCLTRVTARFLLIFKYHLTTSCQTKKQMKSCGKNNSCSTKGWKLFGLSCDAKDCKHCILAFKIYKSLVKESRRLVYKVDYTKLVVVNCTHKCLKRDRAQGWCWDRWAICSS